jgi:glycosyltransferase involved in cell wall biosynthesis
MLVFVQSMWSKAEINGDSNYVVWSQLIRQAARTLPDWHWVVVFPDDRSGFKYEPDGFFALPNVSRVPQRISTRKTGNACSFDCTWYDRLFRKIGFDVIWCHMPEVAGQLKESGFTTSEPISWPALIGQHNYVIHKTLPYKFHEHLALLQLVGALCSDYTVLNSDWCYRMLLDNAEIYLNAKAIQRIRDTVRRIDYGTLEPDLAKDPDRPENDVPVIAYNHRLMLYKQFKTTFKMLDELWREGERFRVRFMNNTNEHTSAITHYPFVECCLSPTRPEYIEKLRGCDLNVTHSTHETFCIAAAESMALEQPVVAPNGITFPQITGRDAGNGYPFLFDSVTESKEMVRRLIREPETRRHWGRIVSKHVRENYASDRWLAQYVGLFEEAVGRVEVRAGDAALARLADTLPKFRGEPITKMFTWLNGQQGSVNGKIYFGTQTCSLTKLARMVRHVGGRVWIEGGEQRVSI